MDEHKLFLN